MYIRKTKQGKEKYKCEEDSSILAMNKTPSGIEPFSLGVQCPELENVYVKNDTVIQVVIPAGATCAKAKEIIYCAFHKKLRVIDATIVGAQEQKYEELIEYEAFLKQAATPASEDLEAIKKLPIKVKLDLFKTDDEVTKAQATLMYVDLIRKISVETEETDKKESEQIKKRAELQKALCSVKADQILEKTVKQIMHETRSPASSRRASKSLITRSFSPMPLRLMLINASKNQQM